MELAEGGSVGQGFAAGEEDLFEIAGAFDAGSWEGSLIAEGEVGEDAVGLGSGVAGGAALEFPAGFVEFVAEAVVGFGEDIVGADLVVHDEEGDDVGVRAEVGGGVEEAGEVGLVGAGLALDEGFAADFESVGVGHVPGVAVLAGGEPAAPALVERDGVVDGLVGADLATGAAFGVGHGGAPEEAREEGGGAAGVALDAGAGFLEGGRGGGGSLVFEEEDGTGLGVHGGDFDAATRHPSEVDVLVEENGAGVLRADGGFLEAGFGEDEGLGFDGDVEEIEEGGDGFFAESGAEVGLAAVAFFEEEGKRVFEGAGVVAVGFSLDVVEGLGWGEGGEEEEEKGEVAHEKERFLAVNVPLLTFDFQRLRFGVRL